MERKKATCCVNHIIGDLCSRQGGDHFFETCGKQVQEELKDRWVSIILNAHRDGNDAIEEAKEQHTVATTELELVELEVSWPKTRIIRTAAENLDKVLKYIEANISPQEDTGMAPDACPNCRGKGLTPEGLVWLTCTHCMGNGKKTTNGGK